MKCQASRSKTSLFCGLKTNLFMVMCSFPVVIDGDSGDLWGLGLNQADDHNCVSPHKNRNWVFVNKVLLEPAMVIHLQIVCGCFPTKTAKLSGFSHMLCKAKESYYLALSIKKKKKANPWLRVIVFLALVINPVTYGRQDLNILLLTQFPKISTQDPLPSSLQAPESLLPGVPVVHRL